MRITPALAEWVNRHWNKALGAIDGKDIAFIAALIEQAKPERIVEIGCASGFSTRVMAALLQQTGTARIDSFDIDDRFYADRTKAVGYLLDSNVDGPTHDNVAVKVWPKSTALDVSANLEAGIDFCFIDAAHKHPWPTIDTLAVLPMMKPGGIIVHHDLQMFRGSRFYATGPKVLCDQLGRDGIRSWQVDPVDGAKELNARQIDDNIFAIRVPASVDQLAFRLGSGFCIGWDLTEDKRLGHEFSARFRSHLSRFYRPAVVKAFDIGLARYEGVLQSG